MSTKVFPHFKHDKYADGGYPLAYLVASEFRFRGFSPWKGRATESVLCAACLDKACASKELPDASAYVGHTAFVHWEGEPIECEDCGEPIESAYGVPEE